MARSILDIVIKLSKQGGADKETVKGLVQVKSAMMQMAAVAASVAAAGYTIKKAYDFAKEGAQLELTATRFDRLAESIGTTSEALLGDLKTATRGMYSDMELMQMGTDLMSLGLAKTSDEAVRLARVSAGLNMNMNQLVLTLTNKTTMRFDALGVSTDGFKEKMKELEEQGYDTDAAFKEAFLQQAEMQLERVGEAADTTMGSFMRLEAQMKNSSDTAKRMAAEAWAPMIDTLADSMEVFNRNLDILQKIDPELSKQYFQYKRLTPEMQSLVAQYERGRAMTEYYTRALGDNTNAMDENSVMTEEAAKAASDFYESVLKGAESLYGKQNDYKLELEDTIAKYGESSEEVQKLKDEHSAAMGQMQYDLLLTKLSVDGLTDAEFQMAVAAGVSFGVFDQEAANAQMAQMELTNAVAEGKLSVEDYAAGIKAAMEDGIVTADELKRMIDNIPNRKNVFINVTTNFSASTAAALSTWSAGEKGYATGTQGWMTVPQGYPNDTYPVMVSSGERFAVIPDGVSATPTLSSDFGGGGGVTYINLTVSSPVTIMDEEKAKNVLIPILEQAWNEMSARGTIR